MDMLTTKKIKQINTKINKLKRVGWKLTPETIVMKINDREITYKQFKRILKRV